MKAISALIGILLILVFFVTPAAAMIEGSSTASNCGEGGNWIDITFTTNESVTLVDAWWDFNGTNVWLDADGSSVCKPANDGVTSYSFYFDGPVGTDTQDFGLTAVGFDGGDYFRFKMDLDLGTTGMPYGADYMGGTLTVEFSDATVLTAVFDTPYDGTNGATASFAQDMPNLEFTVKTGWVGPFVPRSANDASWTSVPAPGFLIGEADSTWLNAVCQNTGDHQAGASRMTFHLDGQFLDYRNLWTIDPDDWNGPTNFGAYEVPGGRHILRVTADAYADVAESDETDNVLSVQYCWQGDYLAPLANVTRAAPPRTDLDFEYGGGGSWWNCDGIRIAPDPNYDWCAIWGERQADDGLSNYMLRLHPASDDPENAFGTNVAASSIDPNLHALLVNTHTAGSGPWDVGVLNFAGHTDENRIGHTHESPYPFDFGIEPTTPYTVTRLGMFQFHVDSADLGAATLTVHTDPQDGPVRMGWLLPDFTVGDLRDLLDEVVTDAEGNAKIDLELTVTGDYCAVVYGSRTEHTGGLSVNVGLYGPLPDLIPMTMTGWHAPIVPQPHDSAAIFNCPLPDTLHGGVPETYLNFSSRNQGTVAADIVGFGLDIDGFGDFGLRQMTSLAPGGTRVVQNLSRSGTPWSIRGGRHTLSLTMDYLDEEAESIERNNDSGRQYCWSPAVLPTNASLTIEGLNCLPDREGGWENCDGGEELFWNCDGLRMPYIPPIAGNWHWCGTAIMPWNMALDIDLQLHVPLTGTQAGFGPAVLAESMWGNGQVDFVLVNDRFAANRPHDLGVLDDVDSSVSGYYVQEARSTWGGIPGRGENGPYNMGAGRMLNLHEYMLSPGPWLITLSDNGTGVDWGMSLYQDGTYYGKSDVVGEAITWQAADGESEYLQLDVPEGSSFCLAVWKVDTGELAKAGSYSLWLAEGVTAVDDLPPLTPQDTRIVAVTPNPFNPRTTIKFDLKRDGPCHLAVYDLHGRLVRTLVAEERRAGRSEVVWDGLDDRGSRTASGVYLARLQADGTTDLLKVTLVK